MVRQVGSRGGSAIDSGGVKKRRRVKNRQEEQRQLALLMEWVSARIEQVAHVPRLSDVVEHAGKVLGFQELSRSAISTALRQHPYYRMSSQQMKVPQRVGHHRPIVCNQLGILHSDIAFYPKQREFEMLPRYQSGFLIAKDVLSPFVYLVILRGNRTAKEMVRAFRVLLQQHQNIYGSNGHKIVSVSFDLERSIMSNQVQSFFHNNFISCHGFEMNGSKSKMAENAIGLLRRTVARLMADHPPEERKWWKFVSDSVASLNSLPLVIDRQQFSWMPADINKRTLSDFLQDLIERSRSITLLSLKLHLNWFSSYFLWAT
jgi:hypothetical protein